jgi:hypothetical protein
VTQAKKLPLAGLIIKTAKLIDLSQTHRHFTEVKKGGTNKHNSLEKLRYIKKSIILHKNTKNKI